MIEEDIHSCGYHCQNPACIKAQRDELVNKFVKAVEAPNVVYSHGWNEALDEAAARINNIRGFGQTTQDSFAVFIKGLKKTI
jgi:pyrimidine deaminase RibD-like protein